MSLHADLSQEAMERLARQRRNSTITSLLIAALSVVLIGLILGIFLLPAVIQETPQIVTYDPPPQEESQDDVKKVQTQIDRRPAAPSSSMSKVIAANTAAPTSVPVPDVEASIPSMDFGMENDFGEGWATEGTGDGSGFSKVPSAMKKRCTEADRLSRLRQNGGTPECEKAVKKSLDWLKSTQNEDGSWGTAKESPVAMTGLALLAYLGHCETPKSPVYGATVSKALTYLINIGLQKDGKIFTTPGNWWVYEHGIATYALAEASTFCKSMNYKIPELDNVTKKAGTIIIDGQSPSGGWHYGYAKGNGGDNSVGFWQIQALKACKHTKLFSEKDLKKASDLALELLIKSQGPDGAIGYRQNSKQSPGLTGGGVLGFQMWDQGDSKHAKAGIDYISKNTSFDWPKPSSNLYYHYYNVQAMINHGGKEWEIYNRLFRDTLLKAQLPDGSWPYQKIGNHGPINAHMTTCLATLMLEAYYRFLPGTGGGK